MLTSRITVRIGTLFVGFVLCSAACAAQISSLFATTAEDGPCSSPPASPRFSIKSGNYSLPLSLRLTARARGAVIFYTTDGWTPTSNSTRYAGPIPIEKTTNVQAIALVPNCSISKPAMATFEFPSATQPVHDAEVLPVRPGANGALALSADAQIPLVFAAPVDSRTAQVGDEIALTLAADLKVGNHVLAPKGTPAIGRVMQVDRSGVADMPGEIQFQVESLNLNGAKIPIHAFEALAGPYVAKAPAAAIGAISTGGIALLFMHGKDARIPAGAPLTATMAAGTLLIAPENMGLIVGNSGTR